MDRKQQMLKQRLEGRTYQEIADNFSISRQRVQQLLQPPKAIKDIVIKNANGKCVSCGLIVGSHGHIHHENGEDENYNDIPNLHLLCISCHMRRHTHNAETRARISKAILKAMRRRLEETGQMYGF